jgi:hypothetical protein
MEGRVCIIDDVTALHRTVRYAEMCLLSHCVETNCITPLFYCCMCVLLINGCFCDSAVLAWDNIPPNWRVAGNCHFAERRYCNSLYYHVSGLCVTNKTGFEFDDRIHLTFIQLVITVHKSLSDTLSSSSIGHSHFTTPLYSVVLQFWFTTGCIFIWVSCYIEHQYPRKRCHGFQESISTETCLSTRSLGVGLHVTISLAAVLV